MIHIKSKEIIIKKFQKKDVDEIYLNWFINKANFKYSRHKNKKYSVTQLLDYFKIHNSDKNHLFLICVDRIKKKKIATLSIYFDKKLQTADVGILIGDIEYKKKGLSKIILKSLFKYLFFKYKLNQITMGTYTRNIAMVKSCIKIGMKIQRIALNKKKNIIYFKKNKKKFSFIGIICKDLGSAIQIYHYIKSFKNHFFLLFVEGPAEEFFKKNKSKQFILLKKIDKIITHSDYVISGTGTSNFEKINMLKIIENGVKVKAVIDHITNIDNRFRLNKKKINPNEIIIFDQVIFDYLKKFFIINKITKLPNYYLKYVKKKISHIKKKSNYYLFIGEPFKKFTNKLSIDQIGLKLLSQKLNEKNEKNNKLCIRLHPKQNLTDFYKYKLITNKYCPSINVVLDRNIELYETIKQSICVFGITSYALLLSANLNTETFHCLNEDSKIQPLPEKRIKKLNKFLIR